MTKEEKSLLLKDLAARLPYGLKVSYTELPDGMPKIWDLIGLPSSHLADIIIDGKYRYAACDIEESIRPYLRPMSSMTEEENTTFHGFIYPMCNEPVSLVDWLNSRHFDYRCLIDKGLAIEAPKEMYSINKTNNKFRVVGGIVF